MMLDIFRTGVKDLKSILMEILGPGDFGEIDALVGHTYKEFRFPIGLWVRVIYDYALTYHRKKMSSEHLLKSLVPLYLGKTASFIMEVADMGHDGAEAEIEKLCREFEERKDYLINNWIV